MPKTEQGRRCFPPRESLIPPGESHRVAGKSVSPPTPPLQKVAGTNSGISVEGIRAVKGLVDKIGAGAVKELADVLSE
jgi:hypothetical protein